MAQAVKEGSQKISISGYIDDLIHCLRKEKESVAELIEYMEDLTTVFRDHLEEVSKAKEIQEGAKIIMKYVRGGEKGEEEDQSLVAEEE